MQSVLSGYPVQDLTLTDQPCLAGGETKSRDVVQPCLKRQDYVFKGAAFTALPQFVQRNRLIKCEWASPCAAKHGHMSNRSERQRNVTSKRADIGSFGHMRRQIGRESCRERGCQYV